MKKMIFILFSIIFIALMTSCGPAIPTKEIEDARTAVERARMTDAKIYAAQDFMDAESDLTQASNLVVDKKNQEAKDKAVASKTKADTSYETARVKRAEDLYQKCGALLDTAEKNFAEKLYPDQYPAAKKDFEALKTVYESKDYDLTYSNAVILKPKLQQIADGSAAEVDRVKNAIASAQDKYDSALNKEIVKTFALDDLNKAIPLLDSARTNFTAGQLNDASSNANDASAIVDAAVKKAEDAYQKSIEQKKNQEQTINLDRQKEIEAQKQKASDYIEQAKQKLEKLKAKKTTGFLDLKLNHFAYIVPEYTGLLEDLAPASTDAAAVPTPTPAPAATDTAAVPAPTLAPTPAPEPANTVSKPIEPQVNNTPAVPKVEESTNITQETVEKYLKLAEESFQKEEYLDSSDYAREAIRLADILLAQEQETIYVVKLNIHNRDCLWKISGYVYNNRTWLWPIIWRANKFQIQDPDLIYPGQKLKIPPALNQ